MPIYFGSNLAHGANWIFMVTNSPGRYLLADFLILLNGLQFSFWTLFICSLVICLSSRLFSTSHCIISSSCSTLTSSRLLISVSINNSNTVVPVLRLHMLFKATCTFFACLYHCSGFSSNSLSKYRDWLYPLFHIWNWIEFNWIELDWIGLNWIGLDSNGLNWIGSS